MSERFVITLEDAAPRKAGDLPPVELRLRRALKHCLRFAQLRATSIYEARSREGELTERGTREAPLTKAARRQLTQWEARRDT